MAENGIKSSYLHESADKMRNWANDHAFIITLLLYVGVKIAILALFMGIFSYFGFSVGDRYTRFHTGDTLVDLLGTRWDSNIYLTIAYYGSYTDPLYPDDLRLWNFSPGYPFIIKMVVDIARIFQLEVPVATAGVLVANTFSLAATVAFFYMSRLYFEGVKAIVATMVFSFFPTTFVFGTVAYAEPVFMAFAILSWYYFEKKRYFLSGFTLALATFARYPGALIFILYAIIYFGRKTREIGARRATGCLLAVPLFPLLVTFNTATRLASLLEQQSKLSFHGMFSQEWKEKANKTRDFLDTGLSWVLISGILPLGWLLYANATAPMSLAAITYQLWGAKFVFPFAGFVDMLYTRNIRWTLEKFAFILLFVGMGLIALTRRPGISLLILGQTLFYSGYIGVHAWGAPRYTGTIFHGPLALMEELQSTKIALLILSACLVYGFKVLWLFTQWDIWLI
ncbi:MAG: hypothetical protein ACFFD4_17475 [Candidatus Odinarchaeota archaeon]